jgi:S-sulfosulfanyl-L-cysteine sulfohydrolase
MGKPSAEFQGMTARREFLQALAATAALMPADSLRALAQQRLTQEQLLRLGPPSGNVTLVHLADLHAQLKPLYFREPSVNLGVGEARGQLPHVTGQALLDAFKIPAGSALAYALTPDDFAALARDYGRLGGLDRIATVLKHIRAERPDRTLLLDGGDTWQNSYTSLISKGQDMVDCMALLKPDAMTGHWEFTLGADRVKQITEKLGFAFLAQNVRDTEWNEPAFPPMATFERGGVKTAVIGQAFPYTPIANPRWMMPNWSFGIREEDLQAHVSKARAQGAELVVLLSHNGFDVDRKLAARVRGIDIILTAHTHDVLPVAVTVDKTLLIASGSHGKFVNVLDLDVGAGGVRGFSHRIIPIFAEVIAPEAEMARMIATVRAPHEAMLAEVVGRTDTLLYRRGNFHGTLDDVICDALIAERDAEIALSPGFRWGGSLLPGQDITREDIYNATAITYPATYHITMNGARLKDILEDVADNLFNPDPYYQQGGDMVRAGGLSYTIDVSAAAGRRISELTLLRTGQPLAAEKDYVVAGWASVNEGTEGPPIYDVVTRYVRTRRVVAPRDSSSVRVVGT